MKKINLLMMCAIAMTSTTVAQVKDSALLHDGGMALVNAAEKAIPSDSPLTPFIPLITMISSALIGTIIYAVGHRHGSQKTKTTTTNTASSGAKA